MPSDSLSLSDLQEIDRLCDSFEAAWHAGLRPRIEEYLNATTLEAAHRSSSASCWARGRAAEEVRGVPRGRGLPRAICSL